MTNDVAGRPAKAQGDIPDAEIHRWLTRVAAALPTLETHEGRTALEALINWGVRFVPPLIWRLSARYGLSDDVRNRMLERSVIRDELRVFFTCSTGDSLSSGSAVGAYLEYAEAMRVRGETPRSFGDWCFYGTRTRLFSYLKRAAVLYGAAPELFRSRDSGKTAIRRLVLAGELVEYLKLKDDESGDEVWCHRTAHPEGNSPPNAFAYATRRFYPASEATRFQQFVVTSAHRGIEARLVDQLLRPAEKLHVNYFGSANNPTIVLSIFQRLVQPSFPLLGTTLDAVFAAKGRMQAGDIDDHAADEWRREVRDAAVDQRMGSETDAFSEGSNDDEPI